MLRVLTFIMAVIVAGAAAAQSTSEEDRGFVAGLLEDALGGPGRVVRIEGFSGALSSTARIDRITVADDAGIWLSLDDVEMTWNRGALLRRRIEIERLGAAAISLDRLPTPAEDAAPKPEAGGFQLPELPVSIQIDAVEAERITLGPTVLGEPVALQLSAGLKLADGAGEATLNAARVDGRRGVFDIEAQYDNATERLQIDLSLQEAPGGIAARMLEVPGLPSVRFEVVGDGSLDDFTADIDLDTGGEPRLAGQVTLRQPEGRDSRAFDVDLGGDVTALFAPRYRPFFGDDVKLTARGELDPDGALSLETFSIAAEAIQLQGALALNNESWPVSFDLSGRIGAVDGAPVVLPVAGPETTLESADITLRFNAAKGQSWAGRIAVQGLVREGIEIARGTFTGDGTIDANPGGLGAVTAELALQTTGLRLPDADVSAAIGGAVTGGASIVYREGAPTEISRLRLQGPGYALSGEAEVAGVSQAFATTFDLRLNSPDIRFLSALAGQEIAGAVSLNLAGTADAGGYFDVVASGTGTDLATGIAAADAVLAGAVELDVAAKRSEAGLEIARARAVSPATDASISGMMSSERAELDFALALDNVSRLAAGFQGALDLSGQLTMEQGTWRIRAGGSGPYRSTLEFQGRIAPGPILTYDFAVPDIAPFVPGFSGPLRLQGRVKEVDGVVSTDTAMGGPAGTTATLVGSLAPEIDLQLQGTAPLGLVSPLIAPRSIRGQVDANLRLTGPDLEALSGTARISDATLVLPEEGITIRQIAGNIDIGGGSARLDLSGRAPGGGGLTLRGPVSLARGNNADLTVTLQSLVIEDPNLYRTTIDGTVSISGPLAGGARIGGTLTLAETIITIPSTSIGSFSAILDIDHVAAPAAVLRSRERAGLNGGNGDGRGGAAYPLDLTIRAPARIFVRGRGLDAELGGQLRLTGTTKDIVSSGALELIRGRLDILNQRFVLDRGRVSLIGDFDPFIDFAATTRTPQGTATVLIDGRASSPEVRFEASPPVPQDEVIAQLLFGRDLSQLSAFQALQLANAVATLAGRQGVGLLDGLREGFALDDLDVQTDEEGQTGVRVGKYLSDNVYTDVTVGQGDQTGVSLNIDLTPRITARGSVKNTGETSIGIFYERDY